MTLADLAKEQRVEQPEAAVRFRYWPYEFFLKLYKVAELQGLLLRNAFRDQAEDMSLVELILQRKPQQRVEKPQAGVRI